MSLLVTSFLVAGGLLLGRWIAKGGRPTPTPSLTPTPTPKPMDGDPFADMPCKLGDVVIRAGGDEAWLAGAVIFSEDYPVAVLFVAPDAGKDRGIYARARPSEELLWLEPVPDGELTVGAEPPTALEHANVRYERSRRLPVKVERVGAGAPDVGEQVIIAEYASGGFERLILVTGSGASRAWVGTALEAGMYDVLPSGKSTLDP